MSSSKISMTEGSLIKNLTLYTLPIILTNIVQLFFNTADIIVVGQFCGSNAVAAVGSTGALITLLINIIMGFSAGTGVMTAQGIGAGNNSTVKTIVHTAIPASLIIGCLISFIGIVFSGALLRLTNTPEEILPTAALYLRIYFVGAVSISVYNFGSAILRASGDTKSPLIFILSAGILNVILNIVFVAVFKMAVAGVALATTISQTVAAVLIISALLKRNDACKLILNQMKIHKYTLIRIIKIGLPTSIQSSMFSVSTVIIQSVINSFGAIIVSGNAAAANIEGFIMTSMNAYHQTSANFTAQNIGAGNYKRAKLVLFECMLSACIVGLILGVPAYLSGRTLLSFYITDSKAAIEAGMVRMAYICLVYFLCGIQDAISGAIEGMGATIYSMIITTIGACGFRILWIFTVFQIDAFHTPATLYLSYSISWVLTAIAFIITYFILLTHLKERHNLIRRYS